MNISTIYRCLLALTVLAGASLMSACDSGSASLASNPADMQSLTGTTAKATGDPAEWSAMTAEALWEHIAALDSTVLVGLKEPGRSRGVDARGRALVPKGLWRSLYERAAALGVEVLYVDEELHPLIQLRLSGAAQIEALRRAPFVEYVEPGAFDARGFLMEPGCGDSQPLQTGIPQAPGDIVPYALFRHRVPQAWAISPSAGFGITVGVVDTGTSVYQPQLQGEFATGMSTGRTIRYDFSDPNSTNGPPPWHDTCGHGTKALGVIAAPRDGRSIVGVAYRANAYAVRALDDVTALRSSSEPPTTSP